MQFTTTLLLTAAMATSTLAQVRNLEAYLGQATNCNGNFVFCDNAPPGSCCTDGGLENRFGSIRIANSELNDQVAGQLPSGDNDACGTFVNGGTGSQCISDGPGGYTAAAWFVGGNLLRSGARPSGATAQASGLVFKDGPSFDFAGMSAEQQRELIDIASTDATSEAVPAEFWHFERK